MPPGLPQDAFELGRTCALAAECGRDLRLCAQMYDGLFPAATFDGDFYTARSLAAAFSAPWAGADRLKMAGRTTLWVLALERLVDHTACSLRQVDVLIRDCLAVADGGAPTDALTRFLADLRDELATVEEFGDLRPLWRDQLARMLSGMARAWVWRDTRAEITLPRFVDNADSRGTCFVDLSHWIYVGDPWARGHLEELRAVSGQVQRYLHLLGDLASYRRDVSWGDLNVLTLGVGRDEVTGAMAALAAEADELIGRVRERSPRTADYLWRQMGFNAGYHNISGYGRHE